MKWALLDDDGEVIRFFDFEAVGAVRWPPMPPDLPLDHPDWQNPPF